MAKDRMNVLELLRKEAPDADLDFLREGLRVLIQAVTEAEVATKIGAGLGERSSKRIIYRNGYRTRPCDTVWAPPWGYRSRMCGKAALRMFTRRKEVGRRAWEPTMLPSL